MMSEMDTITGSGTTTDATRTRLDDLMVRAKKLYRTRRARRSRQANGLFVMDLFQPEDFRRFDFHT
jgi:hypothetical protein